MDSLREDLVAYLLTGKEIASRLQTLLQNYPVDHDEEERVLFEDLASQICTSFSDPLSLLHLPASMDHESSRIRKPSVDKNRRHQRKTRDSWTKVSQTTNDGHAWRKYGQKDISDSQFPRCYYRCTNKNQGCMATKQVQRMKENPLFIKTTYFHQHICTEIIANSQLIEDSDPMEQNLISFKATIQSKELSHQASTSAIIMKDTHYIGDIWDSSLNPYWHETVIAYANKPVFSPETSMISYQDHEGGSGFQSCGSTSFDELDHDMEVNQPGDIDNLQFGPCLASLTS